SKNAQQLSIKQDFAKLGLLDVWVSAGFSTANPKSKELIRLEQLNHWRNAIAHSDFVFSPDVTILLAGQNARLITHVRGWRKSCSVIATRLDETVRKQVQAVVGKTPWS
ncbi:MAG: hypothetical protein JST92_13015, partial [Deltaproteobacteria bacterium]|nr:hypothetical protein [Deltaproteobacteria bacterium]